MSAHLEWLTTTDTAATLLRRGEEAADHETVTAKYALVIGHPDGAIIEGTGADLRKFLTRAVDLLDIVELLEPIHN
jgi:hypothetical protein